MNTIFKETYYETMFDKFYAMNFQDLENYSPKDEVEAQAWEDVYQERFEVCNECGGDGELTTHFPATPENDAHISTEKCPHHPTQKPEVMESWKRSFTKLINEINHEQSI